MKKLMIGVVISLAIIVISSSFGALRLYYSLQSYQLSQEAKRAAAEGDIDNIRKCNIKYLTYVTGHCKAFGIDEAKFITLTSDIFKEVTHRNMINPTNEYFELLKNKYCMRVEQEFPDNCQTRTKTLVASIINIYRLHDILAHAAKYE